MKRLLLLIAILLFLPVTALAQNQPPVADAGEDQNIFTGDYTLLDGSATDPNGDAIIAWLWTIESSPAGSSPYISNPWGPDPYFTTDVAGDYVFSLIATDEQIPGLRGTWSQPDFVTIHVGCLRVSPMEHDFGDVEVSSSSTMIFTISNACDYGDIPITVSDIDIVGEGFANFNVIQSPVLPITLSLGALSTDVEVSFTPAAVENYQAALQVQSSDDNPAYNVPLYGDGVYVEPPPTDVEGILTTFDDAIAGGTITGDGPGGSAAGRMGALYNMIEAAGDLIADGDIEGACRQLMDAYQRCDGDTKPPDFITGTDADEVAAEIMALMTSLGCDL